MHYPIYKFFIRRVIVPVEMAALVRDAGVNVVSNSNGDFVVEFPVRFGDKIRTQPEVSLWEQLALAAFLQKHWSDNSVSVSVTFDREAEGKDVVHALEYFQYQLKGVTFLPTSKHEQPYALMPYEGISEERFRELEGLVKKKKFNVGLLSDSEPGMFCDGDKCLK
jgi:hypothetical protein